MLDSDKIPTDNFPDDDSKWIAGRLYYNPNDKRLFPPRRGGFGWTPNFANPYSVVCFFALLLTPVTLMLVAYIIRKLL